jgi:hypothetical protein
MLLISDSDHNINADGMAPCARQTDAKLSMQEIISAFKKHRATINANAVLALQNRSQAVQFDRFRVEKIDSR